MSPQFCDACDGRRLKPEILAVRLGSEVPCGASPLRQRNGKGQGRPELRLPGFSIMNVCSLSVTQAEEFFSTLKLTEFQEKIAREVIKG